MTRKRILYALAALLLLCTAGVYWFLQSDRLNTYVLERACIEVEKALGAKLEIRSLKIDVFRGRAIAEGVTLTGKEGAGQEPLFAASRIEMDAGIASFSRRRVDLRAIRIADAKVRIVTLEDGTTNIPGPKTSSAQGPLQGLINLRLGRLDVTNGSFGWNERRTPFELHADGFNTRMDYLPASRAYRGKVDSARLSYRHQQFPAVEASAELEFLLEPNRIQVAAAHVESPLGTDLRAKGTIEHLDSKEQPLRMLLDIEGVVAVRQVQPFAGRILEPSGTVRYTGNLIFEAGRGYELHGDAVASNLFYRDESTRLGPVQARARLDLVPARLTLTKLRANALGGQLDGNFAWSEADGWRFDGNLERIEMARVLQQLNVGGVPWTGNIHGPLEATGGKRPIEIDTSLEIRSTAGPSPLSGLIALQYREAGNQLIARDSFLALPGTRLQFAGDLRQGLQVQFRGSDPEEWMPVLKLAGYQQPEPPFQLKNGSVSLDGQLSGTVKEPRFRGAAAAYNVAYGTHLARSVKGRIDYSPELLSLEGVEVNHDAGQLTGSVKAVLEDGALNGASLLSGTLNARLTDAAALAKALGLSEPLSGSANISAALQGTVDSPAASGTIRAPGLNVRQLQFTQMAASFQAARRELRLANWEARLGANQLRGSLNLKAGGNDWKLGTGSGSLKVDGLPLNSIAQYRAQNADINAEVNMDAQSDFTWSPEGVTPSKLDGKLLLANISRFNRPVGQLEFTSRTTGNRAALTATGSIRKLPVKGDAVISLNTRLDAELRLQLPKLDFPTVAQLFSREILPSPLPYEGFAEASLYFKGPLTVPAEWDGKLTVPQLQLAPNKEYVRETMPAVADLMLRNEGPVVIEFRRGFVGARDVRFVAKDTNLAVTLQYNVERQTVTGQAKGAINLALLSTFQPDLLTTGVANVDAALRGTSDDPQLNGKLSFQNASFYLRDVITGLDKVNGAILFDRNRATIDTLEAQTGGGLLQLTGFVGFGAVPSYRLQAQASQVRLRYPEGVSTSANASLALSGTTEQSILTGNVTILRSNIGQLDTAQLISQTGATAASAPVKNQFLRNLQFDVRVEAAPNAEFSSTLTKDIKAELALRLRGTPDRPVLLGRIAATQGEIDFFGSRYEISRGEVLFTNPLKIEPVINLDLETRVRGVVISMNFSGPASKLNMSYRSDPPLQSSEILALLTVGRNPGTLNPIAPTQAPAQGMFGGDSSVILGAAVSAGINGRLQRFFGISRVRLDPQLTGIDNVPQARLTLEQQVSRDVTLTYITNLNRTQQQIVRIDWDISRTWSVVAIRDENGIFGLDLFFRKRYK
jgi:translocation and assembly module TamB